MKAHLLSILDASDSNAIGRVSEGESGVNDFSSGLINEYFKEDGTKALAKRLINQFSKYRLMAEVDMVSMVTDVPSGPWLLDDDLESARDMSIGPISCKLKRCAIREGGGTCKISVTSVKISGRCLR